MRPSSRFVRGELYFIVMFADKNLRMPLVQTLVFRKEGKRKDGRKYFLFKEFHLEGSATDFLVNEEDVDSLVLDQSGLLKKLKHCFDGKLLRSPWPAANSPQPR